MYHLYRFLLSLHLIAVISWMAGLLYLYRLFVYHAEESESVVKQRFQVMEKRLYQIITMPAMLAALVFGIAMIALNPELLRQPWMHGKLFFVVLLIGITHYAKRLLRMLESGESKISSKSLRVLNEVPTILMIVIILLIIMRPLSS